MATPITLPLTTPIYVKHNDQIFFTRASGFRLKDITTVAGTDAFTTDTIPRDSRNRGSSHDTDPLTVTANPGAGQNWSYQPQFEDKDDAMEDRGNGDYDKQVGGPPPNIIVVGPPTKPGLPHPPKEY